VKGNWQKGASKMLMRFTTVVDFINILQPAFFIYESVMNSFSILTPCVCVTVVIIGEMKLPKTNCS